MTSILFAGGQCNCRNYICNFAGFTKRRKFEVCPCEFLSSKILSSSSNVSSILSVLDGEHSIGGGILGFLTPEDGNSLRLTCREMKQTVSDFRWTTKHSFNYIEDIVDYQKCFPNALHIELNYGEPDEGFYEYDLSMIKIPTYFNSDKIVNDFIIKIHIYAPEQLTLLIRTYKHLIKYLYIVFHSYESNMYHQFSDDDFKQLSGIKNLNIKLMYNLTDNIIKYIQGVENLDITWCNGTDQNGVYSAFTDDGIKHFRGIKTLKIGDNPQLTNNIFQYLSGIKELNISQGQDEMDYESHRSNITDENFQYIESIEILDITNLINITGDGFKHLKNLKKLTMNGCKRSAYEKIQIHCPNAVIIFNNEYEEDEDAEDAEDAGDADEDDDDEEIPFPI
jgi:hypothetical protein